MFPLTPSDLNKASQTWLRAARELGVRVSAPFTLSDGNEAVTCLAFLPDFGSPNGMVVGSIIGPKFETDNRVAELAKRKAMFCSFINVVAYGEFDEATVKEALQDWDYFGPPKDRPSWLAKRSSH